MQVTIAATRQRVRDLRWWMQRAVQNLAMATAIVTRKITILIPAKMLAAKAGSTLAARCIAEYTHHANKFRRPGTPHKR